MRQTYQRERGRQYLILSEDEEKEENYQIRMIQENRISGCLNCHLRRVDATCFFCYDVTSLQPLSELFSYRKIDKATLVRLLETAAAVVQNLEQYLLPADGIVLEKECIFGSPDLKQFVFCYYPFYNKTFTESLRTLSVELLTRLDQNDQETVIFGYSFYQICTEESTGEQAILRVLASEMDYEDPVMVQQQTERDYFEQAKKEERDRILDDFFRDSEEEEIEEEQEKKGKQIRSWLFLVGAVVLGIVIARRYSLEVGLGAGVLCIAIVFLIKSLTGRRKEREEEDEIMMRRDETEIPRFQQEASDTGQDYFQSDGRQNKMVQIEEESPVSWLYPEEENGVGLRTGTGVEKDGRAWEKRSEREGEPPVYGRETVVLSGKASERTSKAMLVLYEKGNPDHQRVLLGEKTYILGSSPEVADIRLESAAVSRMHAKLTRDEKGGYQLTDLRSRNGTYLNGKEIVSSGNGIALSDGDRIRLADCEAVYTCTG